MTQRIRLDAYLAEQAAGAGAELRDGVKVEHARRAREGVEVTAGGERLHAAALVGADGVNGICGRALGLGGNQAVGVALEGNVPYDGSADDYRGRAVLELGIVPGGYGWVFPKGDHANIGLGGWEHEGPGLRERLRGLCEAHGVAADDLEGVRGYRLPLRSPSSSLARGRAAVIGDAAGLVDPVSGDGMFEAFLSGKLASEAVLDVLEGRAEGLEPYGERLTAHARDAPLGLVGREGRARPLSARRPSGSRAPESSGARSSGSCAATSRTSVGRAGSPGRR